MTADMPELEHVPCHAYVPPRPSTPVPVVLVHGAARRALAQFCRFVASAAAGERIVVAPDFGGERFVGFQRLRGAEGPLAAADAFRRAVSDVAARVGAAGELDLVGFSGGAQFVHRFAMLFPGEVRRVVAASAGWYTYLDPERPFPRGSGAARASGGRTVDVERFLAIPLLVLVGEHDVEPDRLLRRHEEIDREQGVSRRERAERWVEHLRAEADARGLAPQASLDVLPGTGHSFNQGLTRGGLGERAFAFLADASARVS